MSVITHKVKCVCPDCGVVVRHEQPDEDLRRIALSYLAWLKKNWPKDYQRLMAETVS